MMQAPAFQSDHESVLEVDVRVTTCIAAGCGGMVVRHSLGGGQSVDRCTRCFRRYQVRATVAEGRRPGAFRRFIDDFVAWRDD
ncbi:MAG: hypothetical protein HY873_05590 [Chloroflexi bacterium]|nr:hypothetical protein [Chloroflexota bacterium]